MAITLTSAPRTVNGALTGRYLIVLTNDSLSFTSSDLRRFTDLNEVEVIYNLYHFGIFSDQLAKVCLLNRGYFITTWQRPAFMCLVGTHAEM